MTIVDRLSSSQGKRSKEANKTLAKEIVNSGDFDSINELVMLSDKNKIIQSDSIEVLYELGYLKPELIEQHEIVPTRQGEKETERYLSSSHERGVDDGGDVLENLCKRDPGGEFVQKHEIRAGYSVGSPPKRTSGGCPPVYHVAGLSCFPFDTIPTTKAWH